MDRAHRHKSISVQSVWKQSPGAVVRVNGKSCHLLIVKFWQRVLPQVADYGTGCSFDRLTAMLRVLERGRSYQRQLQ